MLGFRFQEQKRKSYAVKRHNRYLAAALVDWRQTIIRTFAC